MAVIRIDDHVAQGLERLIHQYKGKPRLEAWLTSYLEEVQELENAIWDVMVSRLLDQATGDRLEVLGKIVGQPRTGEGDAGYRLYIKARIVVNKSRGRAVDICNVVNLLFEGKAYRYVNRFPAGLEIRIDDALEGRPSIQGSMVQQSAAAGVRADVVYSVDEPEDRFAFGGSEGAGFGGGLMGHVSIV